MSPTTTLDKSTVLARAQEANAARTRRIEALFDATQTAADAHAAVCAARERAAVADTAFAKAHREALEAGWTAAELKASGLPTPPAPPRTPRRNGKRSSTSAAATSGHGRSDITPKHVSSVPAASNQRPEAASA